jgi:hypothetical protein
VNELSNALEPILLLLHFISVLLERKKAHDFKKRLEKNCDIPQYLKDTAEMYVSFLGYISFALLAIHAAVI